MNKVPISIQSVIVVVALLGGTLGLYLIVSRICIMSERYINNNQESSPFLDVSESQGSLLAVQCCIDSKIFPWYWLSGEENPKEPIGLGCIRPSCLIELIENSQIYHYHSYHMVLSDYMLFYFIFILCFVLFSCCWIFSWFNYAESVM